MSIKGLFFSLLMYVGLVWVGAAYLNPGPNSGTRIRQFGLLWTGVGLAAVLAWIIATRLFAWFRLRRTRRDVPKPAAPKKPEPVLHEDDAALLALIAEADATLAKAPAYAGVAKPLATLPLYLLVGPEHSGKTSTFANSGLDPQLVAGQVAAAGPLAPTRIANVWLAKGAIFVEVAGRLFRGDLGRWTQFLRVLESSARPTGKRSKLRRLWQEPEPGLRLCGVIAFCEAKEFTGGLNPDKLAGESRAWQERLGVIGEVFGVEYPVYQVIAKSDTVPFFDDYFKRTPEPEAQQVLGCTLERLEAARLRSNETFAEVEGKRLSAAFNALYYSLAERRIAHLAHEPDASRRPGVYEFPRELKRVRPALVQFLAETYRPNPLRSGPVLRGFYLTGYREVEALAAEVGATRADWSVADVATDATRLFRGDATQIFRPEDVRSTIGRGGTTRRWVFTSDLFHKVILPDRPARKVVRTVTPLERYRRPLMAAVCGLCGLLCILWLTSWTGNRKLLNDIRAVAIMEGRTGGAALTLGDLRALDALRIQTRQLAAYDRNRPPLSLRWGLYAGNRLADPARRTYFRRFQQVILNDLNGSLVAQLEGLPANPSVNDTYDPVYRILATHLMISSAACTPDIPLVSRTLKQTADQLGLAATAGAEGSDLVRKQIDFYGEELRYGNPCRITENTAARDRGRVYLANIKGVERIYASILASVDKSIGSPQRLADLAPNYATVLSGPAEVPGLFTLAGWAAVEKAAAEGRAGELGDACVVGGPTRTLLGAPPNAELAQAIQERFARDYVRRWRTFVTGFSVARYASAQDAARKLEILAEHRSPLLAVLYMTARQTSFPTPAQGAPQGPVEKLTKPVTDAFAKLTGESKTAKTAATDAGLNEVRTSADVMRVFQPVHVVVPGQSDTWVTDKNSAYVEGLAQLGRAMGEVARADADPAVQQAAEQSYVKAMDAARQLARAFKPVGVEGIDTAIERLLEQPIEYTRAFMVEPDRAIATKVNGELRRMCSAIGGTFRRYPFNASGADADLQEIARAFAPGTGAVWQFQAQSLAEFVVKDGAQWKAKDPAKKPQVTSEMLALLNHAQKVADVFYPAGATQPLLTFVFRPRMDSETILQLQVDGQKHEWTNSLQKQFTWPAPAGTKDLGAVARMRIGAATVPVASEGGVWGIFRVMRDAEPRPVGSRIVEWRKVRGGEGRLEPIDPPARLEIVEFPGGADVFNPRFFEGFACPVRAVQ